MIRAHRPLLWALVLHLAGCGGSEPPPVHPKSTAKRKDDESDAARQKASRIARLDAEPPAEPAPESVVQVSLEPLVTGVRPGQRFWLAAHFRIAPGYRISWKNPGDV